MKTIAGIPVLNNPENPVPIGTAEIREDGSVVITIEAGQLENNPDIESPHQIRAFYASYTYWKSTPATVREHKELE